MNGDFIFAQPLHTSNALPYRVKKRKRKTTGFEPHYESTTVANASEYTAVATPDERNQRKLAGQPLTEVPPSYPFPHAAERKAESSERRHDPIRPVLDQKYSLRQQHLASMTALLHNCLGIRDYSRASRALGLILRSEINGRAIDLRHAGLWRIGAEILLRMPEPRQHSHISREGFTRAKLFYDKLALQHPWHRSWPNVVNAQDFRLAMFGLWIYITCQESSQIQATENDVEYGNEGDGSRTLEAKKWELLEAQRIAGEMDGLLGTIPFIDDLELIRLRGMMALWIADLLEAIEELELEAEQQLRMGDGLEHQEWYGKERELVTSPGLGNEQAVSARNLAATMFARLRAGEQDELDIDSDENHDV